MQNKNRLNEVLWDTASGDPFQFQKNKPVICFPYLTRLLLNLWYTLDGVLPAKGRTRLHNSEPFHGYICVTQSYDIDMGKMTKPKYEPNSLSMSMKELHLFLILEQKTNDRSHLASDEHRKSVKIYGVGLF
jgi:hypothetical protein